MRCIGWVVVGWTAVGCQRLEVTGPGDGVGDVDSGSSSGAGTAGSDAETTAADTTGGGDVGSGIPGCEGNPPADPRYQEDGAHSNCNGEACGCDEVCVRPHLVCSCNDDGCDYHAPPVSCRAIPPQCVGLRGDDAADCMLPTLCDEEDDPAFSSYHAGELACSPPYGDCL